MQKFCFISQSRKEEESVAPYITELCRLVAISELQCTLDKILWDRLVWGSKNDSIQKKLLQEKDLTFQRALVITQRSEVADQNLRDMKAPKQELNSNSKGVTVKCGPVHKVSRRNSNTKNMGGTCDHCGTPGHLATVCRFQDQTCHKCRKRGHLAKVCRQSKFNPKQPPLGAKLKRPVSQPV